MGFFFKDTYNRQIIYFLVGLQFVSKPWKLATSQHLHEWCASCLHSTSSLASPWLKLVKLFSVWGLHSTNPVYQSKSLSESIHMYLYLDILYVQWSLIHWLFMIKLTYIELICTKYSCKVIKYTKLHQNQMYFENILTAK